MMSIFQTALALRRVLGLTLCILALVAGGPAKAGAQTDMCPAITGYWILRKIDVKAIPDSQDAWSQYSVSDGKFKLSEYGLQDAMNGGIRLSAGSLSWKWNRQINVLIPGLNPQLSGEAVNTGDYGELEYYCSFSAPGAALDLFGEHMELEPGAETFILPSAKLHPGEQAGLKAEFTVPTPEIVGGPTMLLQVWLKAPAWQTTRRTNSGLSNATTGLHMRVIRTYEWCPGELVLPPCMEALAFYEPEQLVGYYTGEPSLNYSRGALSQMLVDALGAYRTGGGKVVDGSQFIDPQAIIPDAPNLAYQFATGALPTGKEAALQAAVRKARRELEHPLTPGEMFFEALKVCGGNVRDALVTCHAALYRDGAGANRRFIEDEGLLDNIRNPEGYSVNEIPMAVDEYGQPKLGVPRELVGHDEQGVWYHFFGVAAMEYTDDHNLVPYVAAKGYAMSALNGDMTKWVREHGVPASGLGGWLSDLAVAIEHSTRTDKGSPIDPDKYCVNYAAIAAGKTLRQQVGRALLEQTPGFERFNPDSTATRAVNGVVYFHSPLSLELTGLAGERFSFDQRSKLFDGNTSEVDFEILPEPDGTWGLCATPCFAVRDIKLTAVADGPAVLATYDRASNMTQVRELTVKTGDVLYSNSFATLPALIGNGSAPGVADEAQAAGQTGAATGGGAPPPNPPPSTTPQPPVDNTSAEPRAQVLFSNMNAAAVTEGAALRPVFKLPRAVLITKITTYHWNGGRGATPGELGFANARQELIGPWQAYGVPGMGGVANAFWVVEPRIVLPAGTYTLINSGMDSWSHNAGSQDEGICSIEGYGVE
jgi:hypothetical protein